MIINVRGTSGTGKSTVIHNILKKYPHKPVISHGGKHMGYKVELTSGKFLYVVGKYETQCGGCDGILPGVCECFGKGRR